jgi:2-dehydro-3-deoxygalactonokinase
MTTASGRPPRLIALDWGTSSLRAYLLGGGHVLEERTEPWGIMHTRGGDFANALQAIAGSWLGDARELPIVAAGMIGSAQGWCEVPYLDCPADLAQLARKLHRLSTPDGIRLHIVPGVIKRDAPPDVMRGEETQVMGAIGQVPGLQAGARLVLPGTHSKWVDMRDGVIEGFVTYVTGELFAVLRDHSILGRPARDLTGDATTTPSDEACGPWFDRGVAATRRNGPQGAMPLLFSVRTLVLTRELAPADSFDYLSGLLIGEELRCAVARGAPSDDRPMALVGDARLCRRYQRALAGFGFAAVPIVAGAAAAGMWRIAATAGLVHEGG